MKMINSFHFIRASQFILLEMNRCATYVFYYREKKNTSFFWPKISAMVIVAQLQKEKKKIEEGLFAENIWHRSSPAYKVSRHIVVLARSSVPTTSDACRYIFFGVLLLLWMR